MLIDADEKPIKYPENGNNNRVLRRGIRVVCRGSTGNDSVAETYGAHDNNLQKTGKPRADHRRAVLAHRTETRKQTAARHN